MRAQPFDCFGTARHHARSTFIADPPKSCAELQLSVETKAGATRCASVVKNASLLAEEANVANFLRIEAPCADDSIGNALRCAFSPDQRLPHDMVALLAQLEGKVMSPGPCKRD
ncbi:hypothetical protein ACX40Y_16080 [Sphingomonas sp. RS6]